LEVSNDDAAMQFRLGVSSLGNVRTTTLRRLPKKRLLGSLISWVKIFALNHRQVRKPVLLQFFIINCFFHSIIPLKVR